MKKESEVGQAGLTKFDLKKYLKNKKVSASDVAREYKISPQALNYRLNRGVLEYSFVEVISKLLDLGTEEIMEDLKTNYIK